MPPIHKATKKAKARGIDKTAKIILNIGMQIIIAFLWGALTVIS